MPDNRSNLEKLVSLAAIAQDRFGDDELELFAEEYWAKRGWDYKRWKPLKEVDNDNNDS